MEPRDAERFEEGIDSEFQDAQEGTTGETDTGDRIDTEDRGPGEIDRGFGSACLRECLDRINQSRTVAPATLHSGGGTERSADPPQILF